MGLCGGGATSKSFIIRSSTAAKALQVVNVTVLNTGQILDPVFIPESGHSIFPS